jgi:hypothetical protein
MYTMLGARQAIAPSTSSAAHASRKRRTTFSLRATTGRLLKALFDPDALESIHR